MSSMPPSSPMRLYWSSRSPFVRKAMIAAHETGVASRIETIRVEVAVSKLNSDVMAHNPLNKIPTLVLENGEVLCDSARHLRIFRFAEHRSQAVSLRRRREMGRASA